MPVPVNGTYMLYHSAYLDPPLFSCLATGILAVYVLKYRKEPLALLVSVLMFAVSFWALVYFVQVAATQLWLKILCYKIGTICAALTGSITFTLAVRASGFHHLLTTRWILFICAAPWFTTLAACMDGFHTLSRYGYHLVQSGPLLVLGSEAGPLWVVHLVVLFSLLAAALVLWAAGIVRQPAGNRARLVLLIIGTSPAFFVDLFNVTPFKGFSLATSTFWFTGICYTVAILRHRLLEVQPVARSVLFESLEDPVLIVDRSGRLANSNRSAQDLFGPRGERNWNIVDDVRRRFSDVDSLMAPVASSLRSIAMDQLKERTFWRINRTPLVRGRHYLGTLIQFHDVTDLKRAEESMRAATQAAEEANRAKSIFLATVSHELRTPLQAIIGFCDLAQETRSTEYLSMINDASLSLLDLVNSILDLSRIEAGRMEFASIPFSLRNDLVNLAAIYRQQAERKSIRFTFNMAESLPENVIGDPVRLRQVLTNIIGNAIKFTERGGVMLDVAVIPSSLEDRTAGAQKTLVRFAVTDTGIGIPEEKRKHVFESFTQADPDITRRYGGSGLGAAIARRLAVMMDGDITFESVEGKGSTFLIHIPFEMSTAVEQISKKTEKSICARPLSILVAEDSAVNQRLLFDALTLRGHRLSLADDGQEAVAHFRKGEFDLVFMDVMMPRMNGLEATRQIRAIEATERRTRTPIVAVTANTDAPTRRRCLEAGMDDVLTKPITLNRLNEFLAGFSAAGMLRTAEKAVASSYDQFFDSAILQAVVRDPKRVAHYAALLLTDLDREMAALVEAFTSGDRVSMLRAAHSIKGATRPVRGSTMSALAYQLESNAERGAEENITDIMGRLQNEFDRLRAVLKNINEAS